MITEQVSRIDLMNNHTYILPVIFILVACYLISLGTVADTKNISVSDNLSSVNGNETLHGIEYPVAGNETAEEVSSSLDFSGNYASAGQLRTDFSGTSVEATGNNQVPSAEISFSDKSAVSGFIKQFMKSFHYESGVDQ